MQVIDQINGSALFAQSAYSASIATNDDLGRKISTTYLTAVDLSPYATTTLVEETSGAITSLIPTDYYPDSNPSSFATENWVTGQGYITGVNIPESATWNEVSTTVQTNSAQWGEGGGGGDAEVNSFVYDNSATINEVNSAYQTNSASYLTEFGDTEEVEFEEIDLSSFATSSQINELSAAIDYVSANAGDDFPASADEAVQYVQNNSATINDVSTSYKSNSGSFLTTADSANFYPANNPSGFITGVNLSNYYTKDETSGKEELSNAFANVPTPDYEVESYIHNNSASIDESTSVVQSNSSTWSDVTAYQSNSANYITAHQSLDGYATEDWVTAQGYITEVSIPESANWEEATSTVQTNSSNWDNVTNKLDTTSFSTVSGDFLTAVDLTPYQTIEGMTAYQPAGDYATTADLALKQDTLTFGYDEQDRINSINNSALAGGGDVPEDVMVETNLEYNAVNEISGYNGSAIAQYGAEKQWLTHDDTIVHVSNSAQYAFGCNISALQRLMGIDETVLFSGDAGTSITLSESPLNFNKLKIISRAYINSNLSANFGAGSVNEYVVSQNLKCVIINGNFAGTSGTEDNIYEYYTKWTGCDTTAWTRSYYKFKSITASSFGNAGNWASPYIIYGIGRKS